MLTPALPQKKIKPKGQRLKWTPVEKTQTLSLKNMNISGHKVSPDVINERKKFVNKGKRLLIP
jgi:hypothetical protein